jgi:hypothetical protein
MKQIIIPIGCPVDSTDVVQKQPTSLGKMYTTTWNTRVFDAYPELNDRMPINGKILRRIICPYCGARLALSAFVNRPTVGNEYIEEVDLVLEQDPSIKFVKEGLAVICHAFHGPESNLGSACCRLSFDNTGAVIKALYAWPHESSIYLFKKTSDCFTEDGYPSSLDGALASLDKLSTHELAILIMAAPDRTLNTLPPGEQGALCIRNCLWDLFKGTRGGMWDPVPDFASVCKTVAGTLRKMGDPNKLTTGWGMRLSLLDLLSKWFF